MDDAGPNIDDYEEVVDDNPDHQAANLPDMDPEAEEEFHDAEEEEGEDLMDENYLR